MRLLKAVLVVACMAMVSCAKIESADVVVEKAIDYNPKLGSVVPAFTLSTLGGDEVQIPSESTGGTVVFFGSQT